MDEALFALFHQCTVRVSIQARTTFGTGFFVAPGLVLTCSHVIAKPNLPDNLNQVQISWGTSEGAVDRVEAFLPEIDVVLLRVNLTDHPCVLLSATALPRQETYTFGYTEKYQNGDSAKTTCEGWTNLDNSSSPMQLLKLGGGQIREGLSGAPLLNLHTGGVCGIMRSTRDSTNDLGGRAVPISEVFRRVPALEQWQREYHQNYPVWLSLIKFENLDIPWLHPSTLATPINPFTIAGPLSVESVTYVERSCDARLCSWINSKPFVAIQGGFQTGKSSLINRLATQFNPEWRTIIMDLDGMRTESSIHFIRDFYSSFNEYTIQQAESWSDVVAHLREQKTLLFLDEFGKLSAGAVSELMPKLYWLAQQAGDQIRIIAALPVNMAHFCKDKELYDPKYCQCWQVAPIPLFEKSEVEQLLRKLPDSTATIALQHSDHVYRLSTGHPRRVQCLCYRLFEATRTVISVSEMIQILLRKDSYE